MASSKRTGRRKRLVPDTGVECFEVRIVQWIAEDGSQMTSAEVTTPDGDDDTTLNEVRGAIATGADIVRNMYEDVT